MKPAEDPWQIIAARARHTVDPASASCDPAEHEAVAVPPGFVRRVLEQRRALPTSNASASNISASNQHGPLSVGRQSFATLHHDERMVVWAAGLALAASMLLSVWSWPVLEIAWAGPSVLSDTALSDISPMEFGGPSVFAGPAELGLADPSLVDGLMPERSTTPEPGR